MTQDQATTTIRDFFRRHHAVRATSSGPSWTQASDAALMGWFNSYRTIAWYGYHSEPEPDTIYRRFVRKATKQEQQQVLPMFNEVCAEIARRGSKADSSPEMFAASITVDYHTSK